MKKRKSNRYSHCYHPTERETMSLRHITDPTEREILTAIFEAENGTYSSYTLMTKLNPTVQFGTEAASVAFVKTRDATERLILKNLVKGTRKSGADGVYFEKLKLTGTGEKTAIQQRKDDAPWIPKLQRLLSPLCLYPGVTSHPITNLDEQNRILHS